MESRMTHFRAATGGLFCGPNFCKSQATTTASVTSMLQLGGMTTTNRAEMMLFSMPVRARFEGFSYSIGSNVSNALTTTDISVIVSRYEGTTQAATRTFAVATNATALSNKTKVGRVDESNYSTKSGTDEANPLVFDAGDRFYVSLTVGPTTKTTRRISLTPIFREWTGVSDKG